MNHKRELSITLTLSLLLVASGCSMFFPQNKPSVVIASPPSGSVYHEGEDVAVQSSTMDAKGISRVELIVDGVTVRTDPAPNPQPQFVLIQTWKATQGTHTLTVRAYNSSNTVSDPVAVSITVAPAVALNAPPNPLPTLTSSPSSPSSPSTPTPTPTPAPNNPPPAPPVSCVNDSAFVADVTVPNGTVLAGGQPFNKIWRIQNIGTCVWGVGYDLVFISGEVMGGTTIVALPNTVSGATADLLVPMNAPSAPGTHSGQWRTRANGVIFGTALNISISVPPSAPPCPGPPAISSFTASPNPITAGNSTTLSWGAVTNASSVAIDHSIGGVSTPGNRSVNPASTTTFVLTATGCGGVATSQVTVTVNPAPPAAAAATTQILQQTSIAANSSGPVTANCPSGTVLTGGGFASGSSLSTKLFTQSKNGNGWEVYLNNATGSSQLINAYAICLSGTSGSSTQVVQQSPIAANSSGTAVAACPVGTVLTGGGFASQSSLSTKVFTQSKNGNSWEVYFNNGTGSSQLVNAYAICLSGTGASSTQVVQQTSIAAHSTGITTANCPAGAIVTGGGFATQSSLSTEAYTQVKVGNGWEVAFSNDTASSQLANAYAICTTFP